MEPVVRSQWTSQVTFILAVIGSAIGLGNIWRFPYIAGEAGGVFIILYIICVLLILPVMTGEILLGRRGRRSPINAMSRLAYDFGLRSQWKLVGWLGVVGGFLILSFYSVIAGWTIAYFFRASAGMFDHATADGVKHIYQALVSDTEKMLIWHTIFILLTAGIVSQGIKSGIEKVISYSMPLLFGLIIFLLIYVMFNAAFAESVKFMFTFDFSKLTIETFFLALGQAFFSLSVGLGAIMVYGSYLPANVRIVRTASVIVFADTIVAIFAGLIVFSLVFKYGLDPAQGPGLVFITLPLAFGQMQFGELIGAVFFLLLFLAAWTSAISLLEPAISWLCEDFNCTRGTAGFVTGGIAWLLGLGTIFSFSNAESWSVQGITMFGFLDYITANIILPLGGALIAIFAGWKLPSVVLREELNILHPWFYQFWKLMLRYISPLAILLILFNQVWESV